MAIIQPFRGYRPNPVFAEQIASRPYDVIDTIEARKLAKDNPKSFLHVVKPEIDLPENTDLYSEQVYAKGAENLRSFIEQKWLLQENVPAFYVYQQRMGKHVQTGIVARASVEEYDSSRIRKHERTRKTKEDDRTRHIDSLNANTGPVFLTYRHRKNVDLIIEKIVLTKPIYDFVADDEIKHTFWIVREESKINALISAFSNIDLLYVADGHHRSASASRVAAARRTANPNHTGKEAYNFFLSVIFPDNQMKILAYNRVILALPTRLTEKKLLAQIAENFTITPAKSRIPTTPKTFKMRLADTWYHLEAKKNTYNSADPVSCLDVAILQNHLLGPILGIDDPRTHNNIKFVGGSRGVDELDRLVNAGVPLAFSLYPTSISQLLSIADAKKIMPPKSTWFEPKLRSGLIVHSLND